MNWLQFFKNAGIPDAAANQYNLSFIKNRIQQSHLVDLDKDTLTQLGVKAIGDQLAILRTIKKGAPSAASTNKSARVKIEAPDSSSSSLGTDASMASFHRKGRPPPDSQEIYHIKLPQGTTPRTQQILRKAQLLHSKGVVRGMTGVRQGGRPVSPIDKTSVAARTAERGTVRVIQQHLGGAPRVSYASRTMTVTVPERQQRQRISFGNDSNAGSIRFANNKSIGKVITNSRVIKRIERPGSSRTNIQQRITYANSRNGRVQMVEEEYDDGEEEMIYEDAETGEQLYMNEDGSFVEYVDQPQRRKKNVFSRITM